MSAKYPYPHNHSWHVSCAFKLMALHEKKKSLGEYLSFWHTKYLSIKKLKLVLCPRPFIQLPTRYLLGILIDYWSSFFHFPTQAVPVSFSISQTIIQVKSHNEANCLPSAFLAELWNKSYEVHNPEPNYLTSKQKPMHKTIKSLPILLPASS